MFSTRFKHENEGKFSVTLNLFQGLINVTSGLFYGS
jgi:hypothetical protein